MPGNNAIEAGKLYRVKGTNRLVTAIQVGETDTVVVDYDMSGKRKKNFSDRPIRSSIVQTDLLEPDRGSITDWAKRLVR